MKETRSTLQKEIIYQAVCQHKVHPTAEEVYSYVHSDYPNISKATVYRVLKQLAEQEKISKLDFDEQARYDYLTKKHFHFKCTSCGKIYDVYPNDEMLEYIKNLEQTFSSSFSINDSDFVLKGICKECQHKH